MSNHPILRRLREAGLRATTARVAVLQIVEASSARAVGAQAIFERSLQRGTHMSLSTVYRTLRQLQAHGLVLHEWSMDRKLLYRPRPSGPGRQHLRLVCRGCERSVTLTDEALLAGLERQARGQGLSLAGQAPVIACECLHCGGVQSVEGKGGGGPRRPVVSSASGEGKEALWRS